MLLTINYQRQSAQDSGVTWFQEMANELKFIFLVKLLRPIHCWCISHHFYCLTLKATLLHLNIWEKNRQHFKTSKNIVVVVFISPILSTNNRMHSATETITITITIKTTIENNNRLHSATGTPRRLVEDLTRTAAPVRRSAPWRPGDHHQHRPHRHQRHDQHYQHDHSSSSTLSSLEARSSSPSSSYSLTNSCSLSPSSALRLLSFLFPLQLTWIILFLGFRRKCEAKEKGGGRAQSSNARNASNPDPPPVQNTFGSKPDSPFQNPQYTSSRGLFGHHRGNNGSYIGRHQVTATISHHKVLNVKIICTIFRSHVLPISPLYIMFGRPTGPNKNYDTLPLNVYILQGEPVYGVPASLKSNTSEHSEVKNWYKENWLWGEELILWGKVLTFNILWLLSLVYCHQMASFWWVEKPPGQHL